MPGYIARRYPAAAAGLLSSVASLTCISKAARDASAVPQATTRMLSAIERVALVPTVDSWVS
eukprot:scaffold5664_cov115-Isochrysis_galbana.AAC.17